MQVIFTELGKDVCLFVCLLFVVRNLARDQIFSSIKNMIIGSRLSPQYVLLFYCVGACLSTKSGLRQI